MGFDWRAFSIEALKNAPGALAVLGAYSVALAVIYRLTFMTMSGSQNIIAQLRWSDYLDASVPATLAILLFFAPIGLVILSDASHFALSPPPRLGSILFNNAVFVFVAAVPVALVTTTKSWMEGLGFILPALIAFDLNYWFRSWSDNKKKHIASYILFLALPCIAAFMIGSLYAGMVRECPSAVELSIEGGEPEKTISGPLAVTMDEGIYLKNPDDRRFEFIPWAKISHQVQTQCPKRPVHWPSEFF